MNANINKHVTRMPSTSSVGWLGCTRDDMRPGRPSVLLARTTTSHFDAAPARVVDSTFGTGFSKNLDALIPGEWQGPVESGLGPHLVLLESRVEGTLPELVEIRPVVEREWANEKRLETRRMINQQLLKDYQIDIEWPKASEAP